MYEIFLWSAVGGGTVLVLQILLMLVGGDADVDVDDASESSGLDEGMNLLSVRSLAAAAATFGLTGIALLQAGVPAWGAALGGVPAALIAAWVVALLMRAMLRLESDGTQRLELAVGKEAIVYLPIPGEQAGRGKVHIALQGRTLECDAVTRYTALPRGATVLVTSVTGDIVEVESYPNLIEVS